MQDATISDNSVGEPTTPPSDTASRSIGSAASHGQSQDVPEETAQAPLSLVGQAKQKLAGTLDSQKESAAGYIESLAEAVQRSGDQFAGQQDWIAGAIGRGAAELNTLAGTVRNKDLGELAGQVQSFARRQPALFIGIAAAVGFAIGRLGKVVASDLSGDDLPTVPGVSNGQH